MAIFRCFEPSLDDPKPPLGTRERDENSSTRFLMLSPLDIVGLIEALYPDRLHLPDAQVCQGIDVAPPSTAGSSTLNASTSDSGSALASSSAPSTSGTSVASRTIVSENLTDDASAGKQDSHDTSTAELDQQPPPKSTNFVKREFPLLLRSICRRLTSLVGRGGTSESDFSRTAWIFIDYSSDGTTFTSSALEIRKSRDPETPDAIGDLEVLKAGVVELLSHCDMSEFLERGLPGSLEHNQTSDQSDPLADLMKASMESAQANLQFSTAHYWWQTLGIYRNFISSTEPRTAYSSLLRDVAEDLHRRLEAATHAAEVSELRLRSLENLRKYQTHLLAKVEGQRKALRVKMWYLSDVIHSATYEEALHVTRALRAMVSSKRAKQPASMAKWARQRLRGPTAFARPEVQTLEAISAPKDYGGHSKLADEQIELTSRWLTRRSIENFCKGEERIHRFCFEVQKSMNKMAGPNSVRNPVLWSSNLFRREKASFDAQRSMLMSGAYTSPAAGLFPSLSSFEHGRFNTAVLDSSDLPVKGLGSPKARPASNSFSTFWNTSQPSPAFTGFGHGTPSPLPPTPTSPRSRSTKPFNSTSSLQGTIPFPSQTSLGDRTSQSNNETEMLPGKVAFAEDIKTSLRSLLISDLGYLLWKQGSETDAWINDCIANQSDYEAEEKRLGSEAAPDSVGKVKSSERVHHQDEPSNETQSPSLHNRGVATSLAGPHQEKESLFPFAEAYAVLLQKMSLSPDPRVKLQSLYELEDLIIKSLQNSSKAYDTANAADHQSGQQPSEVRISLHGRNTPRTKATSLEEVVANCTERRAGTFRSIDRHNGFTHLNSRQIPMTTVIHGTDDIVNSFLLIFRDTNLRPLTLFRDLQYIAAFIPSETLDQTAQGKAFWDAGLAALALKEDLCDSIINRANQITAYHVSSSKSADPLAETNLANTTLRDAANLWLITAKEGSPAAARELGLFYLTHPHLLPRVTMPFSKAKDVYKSVTSIDARIGDKEKGVLDRATFAIVFHWMEFAANGGDKDARDFLKGTGELSGGRR